MRSSKSFLFILLFFTILTMIETFSNKLNLLFEAANKMRVISERASDSKSYVYINNKVYEVYIYHPVNITRQQAVTTSEEKFWHENTLSKLYVCINCVFAEWIRDELVKLIEPVPVLYHSELMQEHDRVFVKHLNELENKLYHNILDTSEKFIDVLLNFQNIFLSNMHDTSNDTQILTALLSLHFKTDYLLNEATYRGEKSDVNIIRLILGNINSIQHFIYLNCNLSSYYDNSHLFGLSTKNDSSKGTTIDTFFDDIHPLGLNSISNCKTTKILWLTIAKPFGLTKWHTKDSYIYVKDAVKKTLKSHDLLIRYWYLQNMFNTIMKHLFTLTLEHFKQNHITQGIVDKFRILQSTTLFDISNLPSDLIKCFTLIQSNKGDTYSEDNTLVKAINVYINSLNYINLKIGSNKDDVASVKNDSVSTLNMFLNYLIANNDYFKCFMRLFEYLHSQYDGVYYRPWVNYPKTSATFMQEMKKVKFESDNSENRELKSNKINMVENFQYSKLNDLNDIGCRYFSNLYHICLHTSIELNLAYSENYVYRLNDQLDYYPRIQYNLTKLKEALIDLTTNYWHLPHFKTIFNIIPQIDLKPTEFFQKKYNEDLKRMVYVIMTELNSYSIEFCSPPEHNFMFFNNLQFDLTGKLSLLYNQAWHSTLTLKNSEFNHYPEQKYSKLVDVFKSIFSIATYDFETYDDAIRIIWKGKNTNFRDILKNISFITLSSLDMYSFYDVWLRFIFAAICFELHQVVNEITTQSEEFGLKYNLMDAAEQKKFPKKFTNIIEMTKNYASFIQNKRNSVTETVTKEFEKIGVFIELEKSLPLKYGGHVEDELVIRNFYLGNWGRIIENVEKLSNLSIRVNESLIMLSNVPTFS